MTLIDKVEEESDDIFQEKTLNSRLAGRAPTKLSVPPRTRRSISSLSSSPGRKERSSRRRSTQSPRKQRLYTEEVAQFVGYSESVSNEGKCAVLDAVLDVRRNIVGPTMAKVEKAEAMLVAGLAGLAEAKMVLDISRSTSVVAAAILETIPAARVVTIETGDSSNSGEQTLPSLFQDGKDTSDCLKRLIPMHGAPSTVVPALKGKCFDMIFINDVGGDCSEYVQLLLEMKLLAETGSIICSGFLKPKTVNGKNGARALSDWVSEQEDLEQVGVPLCFGISFIRRRSIRTSALAEVRRRGEAPFEADQADELESPQDCPETPGFAIMSLSTWFESTPVFRDVDVQLPLTNAQLRKDFAQRSSFLHNGLHLSIEGSDEADNDTSARKAAVYDDSFYRLTAFCKSRSTAEGAHMRSMRKHLQSRNWLKLWQNGETLRCYTPTCVFSMDPVGAMFLKHIVHMALPRRILEIGMGGGYTTMALLESTPSRTKVTSLEADPFLVQLVKNFTKEHTSYTERHKILPGAPMAVLPSLKGQEFDFVFMNVDKEEYYWCALTLLKHNMLSANGVIVCNGVLHDTRADHTICTDPPCELHTFNQWVYDDQRLKQIVLPMSSGLSIIQQTQQKETLQKTKDIKEPPQVIRSVPRLQTPKPSIRHLNAKLRGQYIISGGTVGKGFDIALLLAQCGANGLLLHSLDGTEDGFFEAKVRASIRSVSPQCRVIFHRADLLSFSSCLGLTNAGLEHFGHIDGLVNCATSCFPEDFHSYKISEACARAAFLLTQSVTTHMQAEQIRGRVVNILPMVESSWVGPRLQCMSSMLNQEIRVHTMSLCRPDEGHDHKSEEFIKAAQPFDHLTTYSELVRTVGNLLAESAVTSV